MEGQYRNPKNMSKSSGRMLKLMPNKPLPSRPSPKRNDYNEFMASHDSHPVNSTNFDYKNIVNSKSEMILKTDNYNKSQKRNSMLLRQSMCSVASVVPFEYEPSNTDDMFVMCNDIEPLPINRFNKRISTKKERLMNFNTDSVVVRLEAMITEKNKKLLEKDNKINELNIIIRQMKVEMMGKDKEIKKIKIESERRPRLFKKTSHQSMHSFQEHRESVFKKANSFGDELNDLMSIIRKHLISIENREYAVNKSIANSKYPLKDVKRNALKTEKELLKQILNLSEMNNFLNDIILIENLFNSSYNSYKIHQENARKRFAKNISYYEHAKKPISEVDSFIDLVFAEQIQLKNLQKYQQNLVNKCKQNNIKIVHNSGIKSKCIERAFYKAFYVYDSEGHKQLTDMLRCSLVFSDFDDLYKCFTIIEQLSATRNNGGILRCKDRFKPQRIDFGYRDLLINIYCPGSKVVCEMQLHHEMFWRYKDISHKMYEKARLFEINGENEAYKYANKYHRKYVGNDLYEINEIDDEKRAHFELYELMNTWKLSRYAKVLISTHGYDDITDWQGLTIGQLKCEMGFTSGAAVKFKRKVANS